MTLLTVTLNPCVDRTYHVPGFAIDSIYRPQKCMLSAGGKGINVARAYIACGGAAIALGFIGGANGDWLRRAIVSEGIDQSFTVIDGESRNCIAIIDPDNRTLTEVNEDGPLVNKEDCDRLIDQFRELLPQSEAVVISGSFPPGASPELCGELVRIAQDEFGVRVLLDASREVLRFGAEARPFVIKPNVLEARYLGVEPSDWEAGAQMLRERYGATYVLLTAGVQGSVLASSDGCWKANPVNLDVVSAVGSGDSFIGAFCWAILNGYNDSEALRLAAGAGSANVLTETAASFSFSTAVEIASRTEVAAIS